MGGMPASHGTLSGLPMRPYPPRGSISTPLTSAHPLCNPSCSHAVERLARALRAVNQGHRVVQIAQQNVVTLRQSKEHSQQELFPAISDGGVGVE